MLDILHSEEKVCELNRIMTHCLAGFSGGSLLVSHVSVQQSQGLKPHLILNSQISLSFQLWQVCKRNIISSLLPSMTQQTPSILDAVEGL